MPGKKRKSKLKGGDFAKLFASVVDPNFHEECVKKFREKKLQESKKKYR